MGDILVFETTEFIHNGDIALVLDRVQKKMTLHRTYKVQKTFLMNEDQNAMEEFDQTKHKVIGILKECIRFF